MLATAQQLLMELTDHVDLDESIADYILCILFDADDFCPLCGENPAHTQCPMHDLDNGFGV